MTFIAITLACLLAAPARGPAPPRPEASSPQSDKHAKSKEFAELHGWVERFSTGKRVPNEGRRRALKDILRAVRMQARELLSLKKEVLLELLALHAAGGVAEASQDAERSGAGSWMMNIAAREFLWMRSEELVSWMISNVLILRGVHSPGVRAAAIELLSKDPAPDLLLGLSTCARDPEPLVKSAAFRALVGWKEESVHRLFASLLGNEGKKGSQTEIAAAERHFQVVRLARLSRALAPLEAWVGREILSKDWRRAARATGMSRALPDARAIPILIGAMELWVERSEAGAPVRRSLNDLAKSLSERSGRRLGVHPDRWRRWWKAVRSGLIAASDKADDAAEGSRTSAAFYGLRPGTQRVVFIIDRSTSMEATTIAKDGSKQSRYDEAIQQLLDFVTGLGENARFNVVLFADDPIAWRKGLQPAKGNYLREARVWLKRHNPSGSTNLRSAIRRAFEIDRDGQLDLAALEADTIIVLCDGATNREPSWVTPFLRRVLPTTHMVLHGVQLGNTGNGTLEALARESGGDFVIVD